MKLILVFLLVFIAGCTDAQRAKWKNLGNSGKVKCFSGGLKIYEGESTGKISSEGNSDGYYFKEKGTGRLMEVSGNCVIIYK